MRRPAFGVIGLLIVCLLAACGEVKVGAGAGAGADGAQTDGVLPDGASETAPQPDTTGQDTPAPDATPGDGDAAQPGDGSEVQGNECETAFDCNDKVKGKTPCIQPACENGFCVKKQKPEGEKCSDASQIVGECGQTVCDAAGQCVVKDKKDGDVCGTFACGKKCDKGQCVVATDADYDDQNPCTKDFCDQGIQVVHEPITDVTFSCDDGNQCTNGDVCIQGACKGQALDCGDGFECTLDTCDKQTGCGHTADHKQCNDGDPCTTQQCDLAVGCTVTAFDGSAACDDGNVCTKDDHCQQDGTCTGALVCACQQDSDCKADDPCLGLPKCVNLKCVNDPSGAVKCDPTGNDKCHKNLCDPKSGDCKPTPLNETQKCDDGNACTPDSTCQGGKCEGKATVQCDDNNPCTQDACLPQKGCSHEPTAAKCDDGNACTKDDQCDKGGCVGVFKGCGDGVVCTFDACDKATGNCTNKPDDKACDDKNPCTLNKCDAKLGCTFAPDADGKCDDGDSCTQDTCQAGKCISVNTCACKVETQAKDCDDKNPCTVDTCDATAKKCKNDPAGMNGKACDSGDKCQQPNSGVCNAGVCNSGNKPVDCKAKDGPCATGTCNPATGTCEAAPKPNGTACDADQNGCTSGDKCQAGTCLAGPAVSCAAQTDACNTAACASLSASTYECKKAPTAKDTACDDGLYCTDSDKCDGAGKCVGGTTKACAEAADDCNTAKCDEAKKQCVKTPKPNTITCDDKLFCTVGDKCDGLGACKGAAMQCQAATCQVGKCDEAADKCVVSQAPQGASCSDNDLCTGSDQCDAAGKCLGKPAVTCTGDACNDSACAPTTGKCEPKPKPKGTACDDKQACTKPDTCDGAGKCAPGPWDNTCGCPNDAACNDNNPCTIDKCVNAKCAFTNAAGGAACDDGNLCTKDACDGAGKCIGTLAVSCAGDACNDGVCDPASGKCGFKPKTKGTACSDNLFCTTNDFCDGLGKCLGGPPMSCGKPKMCYESLCTETAKGCTMQPQAKGTSCSTGNACFQAETCDGVGVCGGGSAVPDFSKCSDFDSSTSGDFCLNGKCLGWSIAMTPGGPASRLTTQSKNKDWSLIAAASPLTSVASSGDWRIWSVKKSATTPAFNFTAVAGFGTSAPPLRDIASQFAVGQADGLYFSSNGASWTKATATGIGPALSSAGATTGIHWDAVGTALVGSTLHVTLAGRLTTGASAVLVRCYGPDTGAATWSCAKTTLANTYYPFAAAVRTTTVCSATFPPKCSTSAAYYAGSLTQNTSTGYFQTVNFHDNTSGTFGSDPAGSVPTVTTLVSGDLLTYNVFGAEISGASTMWLVSSGGAIYWRQGGTANEYLANVMPNQGNYIFSGVTNYAGHVLVFGSKPGPTSAQRIPVLLVHKDDAGTQGKLGSWTEFELAHPPFNPSACYSSGLVTGNAHAGPEALGLVANTCTNAFLSKATSLKTALYVRRYVP